MLKIQLLLDMALDLVKGFHHNWFRSIKIHDLHTLLIIIIINFMHSKLHIVNQGLAWHYCEKKESNLDLHS